MLCYGDAAGSALDKILGKRARRTEASSRPILGEERVSRSCGCLRLYIGQATLPEEVIVVSGCKSHGFGPTIIHNAEMDERLLRALRAFGMEANSTPGWQVVTTAQVYVRSAFNLRLSRVGQMVVQRLLCLMFMQSPIEKNSHRATDESHVVQS